MQSTPNDRAKEQGPASTGPPDVEEIGLPEDLASIQYTPTDPFWSSQWGPQSIKCPQAWDIETGSTDVLIAIVDTGIDYNHEDLTHYVAGGYDWYNNDSNPMDDNDHGTHCAGIAAATMDNSIGIAGVAQVGVMAEKVCSAGGSCPWFDCAQGITHAADFGADVISMSFGSDSYSTVMDNACQYAWDEGAVLVAASGNDGACVALYPARYDTVICVGATDDNELRCPFSNCDEDQMELVAPGEDILSTTPSDNYQSWSGTSMSTPHVAGVAALAWSRFPGWTNLNVRAKLRNTADDLGPIGWDSCYGYGRVDAYEIVGGASLPGKAVLIYPAEDIYFDTTPTYSWTRVIDSTWYYLWINGPSGQIFGKWYKASGICSPQTCSVTPAVTLSGGGYSWWILTWNSGGYGPWSDRMDFSVCPPGKAFLKSPSGITTDRDPEYSWDKALGSTWYYLYVYDVTNSVNIWANWYNAKDVCSGGACSELPPLTLGYGKDYAWWLLTWNPIGYGPWSDRMDFTVESAETGFNEDFVGATIPPNWKKAHGAWSVGSGYLGSDCSGDSNWASIYYDADYYNFVYKAKMWRGTEPIPDGCSNAIVVRGSPYPLCDGDNAWKTAYYFQYSRYGDYAIWKATCGCGWEWIQPWTCAEEINKGSAWNTLKVWFVGNKIYFFINDVLVWKGTNDNYDHGRVGLSYYQYCCGDLLTDYATLDIVGVAAEPSEEVSKKQRQLNEKAKIKNAGLPKEYSPIEKQKNKPKNKEGSG
jgi:hypothetical protein